MSIFFYLADIGQLRQLRQERFKKFSYFSPSTLSNIGLISEIDFAKKVFASLGASVKSASDPHVLEIDPTTLSKFEIPKETSEKSRFSMMYAGPLLAKFGKVVFPLPGGDKIGKRPIDRSIMGLEALGAKVTFNNGTFEATAPNGLSGTTFRFPKNSHTGTELLLTASVLANGTTVLENAAAEPEVDDLIKFLIALGADIKRTSPRTIKIVGQKVLHGASHTVMTDRNEAVTYGCMALGTKGEVVIEGADPKNIQEFITAVKAIGGGVEESSQGLRVFFKDTLKASEILVTPYPGFMTDWQPLWATLMTQAKGESVIHETVYESRFDYVPALQKLGSKIELFQPKVENPDSLYNFNIEDDSPQNMHAIKISGPTALHGTPLEVNDVRSGATALFAGMLASGKTDVADPKDQIKRGYEDLVGSLKNLGALIDVVYN